MNIILQKSSGKALRRATSPETREAIAELEATFGKVEARPIAQTSFGQMSYNEIRAMTEVSDLASTYCSACGRGSIERPAADLVVVRQESNGSPDGNWSFFCPEHAPRRTERNSVRSSGPSIGTRNDVLCRNCFTIVPVGSVCGMCGEIATLD